MKTAKQITMSLLSLTGFILSGYLLFHHYQIRYGLNFKSFCNFNAKLNCDAVALNPASEILGVPVAALGLFFYGLVFFFLFETSSSPRGLSQRMESYFITLLAMGLIMDVYFLAVSIMVIHTICPFCAITYISNFFLLALILDMGKSLKKLIHSLKFVLMDLGWGL